MGVDRGTVEGVALMAARTMRWHPERRDEVIAALRSSLTRREAAGKIGATAPALDHACLMLGIRPHLELGRDLPPTAPFANYEDKPSEVANLDQGEPLVKEPEPPPLIDWTGARPQTTGAGLERRLILGDLHIPYHDLRACAAVLALARAIQPHVILILGDFWNMGAVSHHPAPAGGAENHSRAMLQGRAYLEALHRAAPGADMVLLLGNHDSWLEEYELNHPTMAGSLAPQIPGYVTVIPRRRQPYVRGPVAYTHGYGGGEMAAKKYAIEVAPAMGVRHVKAAHHHTLQCHHTRGGCEGWIVGWLGRPGEAAFDYAKNRDHWRVGCVVEDVMGERVTTTPVRIDGGAALFGGRLIAA